ncbi:TRL-like family protein [Desulfosarcina sp. OttesenSCG-928-A07]|nr:TRL-like family protein [Desulfosarcina sp. OttesenSCG-928-G17]MDL2328488.1 TRL-like family protein [Desulfosarcina sp. OttesenSCG-928-A07]
MVTDPFALLSRTGYRIRGPFFLILSVFFLSACGTGPLVGILYTNVHMPLTQDLDETPAAMRAPCTSRVIEIREPISGAGLYAKVNTNAIGEIARENGITELHFADQQVRSILGIWKTNRVYLYGDTQTKPKPTTDAFDFVVRKN